MSPASWMYSLNRRPGRLRQHGEASWFRRLSGPSSESEQVKDVVYDRRRDHEVVNRQRERVVGAGIFKC
jgi:hypothetical protein